MRYLKLFAVLILASALVISCKKAQKEMTLEDFAKIDLEITTTDQKPETIDKIAQKYGYTLKDYQGFAEKVEKDPKLKEQLGDISLDSQKDQKEEEEEKK